MTYMEVTLVADTVRVDLLMSGCYVINSCVTWVVFRVVTCRWACDGESGHL